MNVSRDMLETYPERPLLSVNNHVLAQTDFVTKCFSTHVTSVGAESRVSSSHVNFQAMGSTELLRAFDTFETAFGIVWALTYHVGPAASRRGVSRWRQSI